VSSTVDHRPGWSRGGDFPRRVAAGAILALAGNGVSFLMTTVYQIVVARHLGAAGIGVLLLSLAVSTLLAEASDLGLDYGVLRFGAIAHGAAEPGRFRSVVRRGLAGAFAAGVLASALLAGGATMVASVFGEPGMAAALVPLALAIPFTATAGVARNCLRAMGRAGPSVASDSLVGPGVRLAAVVVALQVGADPRNVAIAYAVSEALALVATLGILWRLLPRGGEPVRPSGLYRYSLPMSLNRLILYTNNQTEVLVLGLFQAAGAVGVFGVTRRLSMVLAALLSSISVLLIPMVADLHHRREQVELDHLFRTATRWLFTIGFQLCLIEILFGRDLLTLFGPGFTSGAPALAILALGQLVNVGTGAAAGVLAIVGRTRLSMLDSLLFVGLSLGLDFLLIPRWSILGAAVANAFALAAVNLLRVVQVRHVLRIVPYDRRILRPLAAGLAAGVVAWLLPLAALDPVPRLSLHVATLGAVYAGLLLAFGVDPADRAVVAAFRTSIASRASRARSSGGGAHVGHERDP
jgi:O-antigen/teichoic acid export membrane protein